MPSPVKKRKGGGFYRRKDGAYVKIRGKMIKAKGHFKKLPHYSKHSVPQDRKRRAIKNARKRRRYPQAYD